MRVHYIGSETGCVRFNKIVSKVDVDLTLYREVSDFGGESSIDSQDILFFEINSNNYDDVINFLAIRGKSKSIILIADEKALEGLYEICSKHGYDFIKNPFNDHEVLNRLNIHMGYLNKIKILKRENTDLRDMYENLKNSMIIENKELELEIVSRLVRAGDERRPGIAYRRIRISFYSMLVAESLFKNEKELVDRIFFASTMHDIGEIGLPLKLLNTVSRKELVSLAEYRIHVETGQRILEGSTSETMRLAATIAQCHHENFDGSGYPEGLAGSEIPLESRIVSVADRFEDLTELYDFDNSLLELTKLSGNVLDPEIVSIFVDKKNHIKKIYDLYNKK
ncbi:MAG: HD domain-containing protein [Candidatus Delongbacteria bacterium]|nr:HD domain-containing protein [Candidatus Delongbacteria bacterium]MBN2833646.1 HD domain-containing protein [Candidatus Delongbacteria bacterium]